MATLLPACVLHALPTASQATLLGHSFFPNLISYPFMIGLHGVFYLAAAMCFVAAVVSFLRGKRYIYELATTNLEQKEAAPQMPSAAATRSE